MKKDVIKSNCAIAAFISHFDTIHRWLITSKRCNDIDVVSRQFDAIQINGKFMLSHGASKRRWIHIFIFQFSFQTVITLFLYNAKIMLPLIPIFSILPTQENNIQRWSSSWLFRYKITFFFSTEIAAWFNSI